jgi:hypothetical protein
MAKKNTGAATLAPVPTSSVKQREKSVVATIADQTIVLAPHTFKSGSVGWMSMGSKVVVDGAPVTANLQLIISGSKPKP